MDSNYDTRSVPTKSTRSPPTCWRPTIRSLKQQPDRANTANKSKGTRFGTGNRADRLLSCCTMELCWNSWVRCNWSFASKRGGDRNNCPQRNPRNVSTFARFDCVCMYVRVCVVWCVCVCMRACVCVVACILFYSFVFRIISYNSRLSFERAINGMHLASSRIISWNELLLIDQRVVA